MSTPEDQSGENLRNCKFQLTCANPTTIKASVKHIFALATSKAPSKLPRMNIPMGLTIVLIVCQLYGAGLKWWVVVLPMCMGLAYECMRWAYGKMPVK